MSYAPAVFAHGNFLAMADGLKWLSLLFCAIIMVDNRLGPQRWFTEKIAQIVGYRPSFHSATWNRHIRSHFGVSFEVIIDVDDLLSIQSSDERTHLLWALFFLKVYNTENVSARFWKVTEKTYRKHLHPMIEKIAGLPLVCFFP